MQDTWLDAAVSAAIAVLVGLLATIVLIYAGAFT